MAITMSTHARGERTPRHEATPHLHARRWWALAVLGLAQFMVILDVTVVNVALPSIGSDLDLGRAVLTWVVTAYTLALGGFMLFGGRLADAVGRRRTFMTGVTLFTLASLASGIALGGPALIAARAAQGLGAALASPAALAMLVTTFDGHERDRALGVWAALGAVGAAVGGVLGGALTSGPGWRWIFLVNLPAGIAIASSIRAVVPADVASRRHQRLDVRGALLATTGVGLLIYGLVAAGDAGLTSRVPIATFFVAMLALALFVRTERSDPFPLLRLELLRRRSVASGTLLMVAASGLLIGMFFLTSMLMQRVLGISALRAGLAFFPAALGTATGAHLAAHVVGRVGARPIGLAGFLLAAAGLAWLGLAPENARLAVDIIPGFALAAGGIGMAFVVATTTALGSAAESDAGITGSVVNTAHELGGALGVAFVSAIAATALEGGVTVGFGEAYLAAAAVAATMALLGSRLLPSGRSAPTGHRRAAH